MTTMLKLAPMHAPAAPDVGVTIYVCVLALFNVFIKVPLMLLLLFPLAPPLIEFSGLLIGNAHE